MLMTQESQLKGKPTNANDTSRNKQVPQPDQRGVQRPVRQIGATPSSIRPFGGEVQ